MNTVKTGVLVLMVFVSPSEAFKVSLEDPVICYILDGILLLYSIVATALFISAKFSNTPPQVKKDSTNMDRINPIYQDLQTLDNSLYHDLNPTTTGQGRKKRKRKPNESEQTERRPKDAYETLNVASGPPVPAR